MSSLRLQVVLQFLVVSYKRGRAAKSLKIQWYNCSLQTTRLLIWYWSLGQCKLALLVFNGFVCFFLCPAQLKMFMNLHDETSRLGLSTPIRRLYMHWPLSTFACKCRCALYIYIRHPLNTMYPFCIHYQSTFVYLIPNQRIMGTFNHTGVCGPKYAFRALWQFYNRILLPIESIFRVN